MPQSQLKSRDTQYSQNTDKEMLVAEEDSTVYLSEKQIKKQIAQKQKEMEEAAMNLDFVLAAQLRDEIKKMKEKIIK